MELKNAVYGAYLRFRLLRNSIKIGEACCKP